MLNWVEIDTNALKNNISKIKSVIGADRKIMGVVKANAYGHGLVEIAKLLEEEGVQSLATVYIKEAIQIRKAGVTLPILVIGYIEKEDFESLIEYNVMVSLYDLNYAKEINNIALGQNKKIKAHIKIDTGMHRLGFEPQEIVKVMGEISNLEGIEMDGIYSHFANESNYNYTKMQYEKMKSVLEDLKGVGYNFNLVHMAKSQIVAEAEFIDFSLVRVGGLMYGLIKAMDFQPVLSFKARVANVKTVKAGETVGYRGAYTTTRETRVGTITVGYADGYGRALSNKGTVLIGGKRCPVIGQICMNQILVDVTDLENVKINDEVVLLGSQGAEKIDVFEIAEAIGTNSYEITSKIPSDIVRIYI